MRHKSRLRDLRFRYILRLTGNEKVSFGTRIKKEKKTLPIVYFLLVSKEDL